MSEQADKLLEAYEKGVKDGREEVYAQVEGWTDFLSLKGPPHNMQDRDQIWCEALEVLVDSLHSSKLGDDS